MDKEFKTLDEQVQILVDNKNINISNRRTMRDFLLFHSYYNFINGTKILFAVNKIDGHHVYNSHDDTEWYNSYNDIIFLGNKLLTEILKIENSLNAVVSYLISAGYNNKTLLDSTKDTYLDQIKKLEDYDETLPTLTTDEKLKFSWKYCSMFTMGSLLKIYAKIENQELFTRKYGYTLRELQTLAVIRNGLAHNTPLTIILTDSDTSKRRMRRKVIKKASNEWCIDDKNKLTKLIESVNKYVEKCK